MSDFYPCFGHQSSRMVCWYFASPILLNTD
jgi:hypothetical protein